MRIELRRLGVAVLAAVAVLADTGAAAGGAVAAGEQVPVTAPPAGSDAWNRQLFGGQAPPDPADASPASVAAFFARLTPVERQLLTARYPLVVGNLDGAPPALRYRANALALAAERSAARRTAADPARPAAERSAAADRAAVCDRLLRPGRRILAFDPRGRGLVAEVYGDLASARRVSVLVPGADTDLGRFDREPAPGQDAAHSAAGMGRALHAEQRRLAPDVRTAVVAWAGYTTPVGLGPDTATDRLARAGAPRLRRLLAGLAATAPDAGVPSLFCHSYGSVVCGAAAPGIRAGRRTADDPAGVTDMVVFGSPGMGVDHARQLGDGVRLWAARDATDWIGDVPYVEIAGIGHGADPTGPAFGARVVSAAGAAGHTGYLSPGTASLHNFAAIALGRYGDVR
ncbi:alpha/beta hydrolase family protein [Streptacidiphilus sp. ASG 303]|uniref:alpha/beta hydrolase n=1 Tax=Streptacidiphilus sp. ASG 303 TaxID=2896847 RepID=UPI001E57F0EB|nr:alpha/beta hydrolase [Streptacidiphilus sp. ASG 303]MCD0482617.1 alpha/beta hydrolase family protein [Streptacidiphilus sp. ASG 303]